MSRFKTDLQQLSIAIFSLDDVDGLNVQLFSNLMDCLVKHQIDLSYAKGYVLQRDFIKYTQFIGYYPDQSLSLNVAAIMDFLISP